MNFRDQIQKRLDSKRAEIAELRLRLASAESYAQALEDTLKSIPRDSSDEESFHGPATLRAGSAMAHAQTAILEAGKPLHISDILKAIGKEDNKENRVSLGGSLGSYARGNRIFTRPGPNVFGLIDMKAKTEDTEKENGPFELKVA